MGFPISISICVYHKSNMTLGTLLWYNKSVSKIVFLLYSQGHICIQPLHFDLKVK